MNIPQWIMIGFLLIETVSHNYRITKNENTGTIINIIATMLRISILVGVLTWGGFWNGGC